MRALACVLGCFGVVVVGAVVGYVWLYKDYVATTRDLEERSRAWPRSEGAGDA